MSSEDSLKHGICPAVVLNMKKEKGRRKKNGRFNAHVNCINGTFSISSYKEALTEKGRSTRRKKENRLFPESSFSSLQNRHTCMFVFRNPSQHDEKRKRFPRAKTDIMTGVKPKALFGVADFSQCTKTYLASEKRPSTE